MTTNVKSFFVELDSTRTLESKLGDIISAVDYGAATTESAANNTIAINSAITAAAVTGASGFVIVPPEISYTEGDLIIPDDVSLLVFSVNGTVTLLTKDQGTTLPVTKGGLVIKSKGNTGILLRSLDYGVSAEPVLQVLDATNGDIAAISPKFVEMDEITDPTAPSANKGRLYIRDNGAGKTELVVRFPTGAVQVIKTEP
jgi:hypothetical protein